MTMKLALQRPREKFPPGYSNGISWSSCAPFLENTRAVLIHRPKVVTTHKISNKYAPHLSVEAYCGTTMTGTKKFTFLDRVPQGKLLCARCEKKATESGLPSASELHGWDHVHLGRVVLEQICCVGSAT